MKNMNMIPLWDIFISALSGQPRYHLQALIVDMDRNEEALQNLGHHVFKGTCNARTERCNHLVDHVPHVALSGLFRDLFLDGILLCSLLSPCHATREMIRVSDCCSRMFRYCGAAILRG